MLPEWFTLGRQAGKVKEGGAGEKNFSARQDGQDPSEILFILSNGFSPRPLRLGIDPFLISTNDATSQVLCGEHGFRWDFLAAEAKRFPTRAMISLTLACLRIIV